MSPYEPKGSLARIVRVFLDAEAWHPSRPGQLSFMASVEKCSDTNRVKVCGKSLRYTPKPWLVGPYDTFQVNGKVEVVMLAQLDPSVDLIKFTEAEGLRAEELPEKTCPT